MTKCEENKGRFDKATCTYAYDGDGNRAFQLNYNPEAECGYGMNASGETFMPENGRNEDGSLTAEGQLFSYICSRTGRAYDLTEYVNDTNRQYAETLTAYTINSGATESYSYAGNRRLSRNNIRDEARGVRCNQTSYYQYDGRGSVTANTWHNGMVTSVYRYDSYGQVELGSTKHTDLKWRVVAGTYKKKDIKKKMEELVKENKNIVRCLDEDNIEQEIQQFINELINQQNVSAYTNEEKYVYQGSKLTPEQIRRREEVFRQYRLRPDFIHMMGTGAVSLYSGNTLTGNVIGDMAASLPLVDAAGYGGDIYGIAGTNPSINRGDYASDLDIVNLLENRGKDTNLIEVMTEYYDANSRGNLNRADEFAKNLGKGEREEGINYLEKQFKEYKLRKEHNFVYDTDYTVAEKFIEHIKASKHVWEG